jgi:hypothetical protein
VDDWRRSRVSVVCCPLLVPLISAAISRAAGFPLDLRLRSKQSAARERSVHGRQSRRARQTCWRADFHCEADDPHDVFRIILTHNRSPFRVQPLHAAIVVDDAELDR